MYTQREVACETNWWRKTLSVVEDLGIARLGILDEKGGEDGWKVLLRLYGLSLRRQMRFC